MRALPAPLLVVTDRHQAPRGLDASVQAALDGGARWFWFRERDLDAVARRRLAEQVLRLVRDAGGTLVIGADVALAAVIGADGVHLPGGADALEIAQARNLLRPGSLVGLSAHGPAELAGAGGLDYATLSPVYPTPSKPGHGPALGPPAIAAAASFGHPVLALGGITPATIPACRQAGAAGVAVMGGVMGAEEPAAAVRRCLTAWGQVAA